MLAGTWLAEYAGRSRYGSLIRFLNDVLLSAPSILVGLFVYEILVAPFGGFSGFAGAVALALLATPGDHPHDRRCAEAAARRDARIRRSRWARRCGG